MFDSADNLYVAEETAGRVSQVTTGGGVSTYASGLPGASGVAFDTGGVLTVSDDTYDLFKVPALETLTPFITGAGLSNPNAFDFDSAGNIYIANTGGFLSKFDSAGTLIDLTLADGLNYPQGVVVDEPNGIVFVAESNGKIHSVDMITGDSTVYIDTGIGSDGGLAMDAAGNLYYSDTWRGRVLKIAAGSKFVSACVSGITYPRGLAFDSLGRLYISDYVNGTVLRADDCDAPVHGAISGVVTQTNGVTPVTDATVCAGPYDESFYWTCLGVSADGSYTIPVLDPYSYRVEAYSPNRERELYFDTAFYNQALPVVVTSGATTSNIDFTLGAGGAIEGTITLTDAGSISGGYVCVNEYDTGNHVRCRGEVINNGALTYSFDHLPSGIYRVEMWLEGYGQKYWNDTFDQNLAAPVTVLAPTATTGINFTFDPGGAISGTVYELDGTTPILDAIVCGESMDYGFGLGCRTVDPADGTFRFNGSQSGNYRIEAYASGYESEFWLETTFYNSATPVVVNAPNETSGINFTLGPDGAISGTISLNDSGVLALANPTVCVNDYFTQEHVRCRQDVINLATGEFVFDRLPSGTYRVVVDAKAYLGEYYQEADRFENAAPVVVTVPGTTANVNFTLEPAGTISGTVRDAITLAPLGGVPVDLEQGGYGVCTNPNGTFTLQRIELGIPHTVRAGGPGWDNCPGINRMREWWQEADSPGSANTITLTYGAGQFETGIDFTLEEGGSFSGIVTEADGVTPVPAAQVCVQVHPWGEGQGCVNVNPDGSYIFTALSTNFYRVDIQAPGFASELYDSVTYYGDHGLSTPVSVTVGANTPGINITLEPGGSISGTIFAADGITPLPNVPTGLFWGGFDRCGNGDGTYTISGLPLNTPIKVFAGGPAQSWMQGCSSGFIREWWQNRQWNTEADPITLTSGPGQNVTGKDFSLDIAGSISGRVTEEDGTTPIPFAQVCAQIHPFGDGFGCINADSDGYYTFGGLGTAVYAVDARADGFAQELYDNVPWYGDRSLSAPVAVTAGANTPNINFLLGPAGTISGTVYAEDGITPLGSMPVDLEYGGFGQCTGPDGTYTISNVPMGVPLLIHAGGQGWQQCPGGDYMKEWWQETPSYDEADPVTLSAGPGQNATGINFTLEIGGSISGTIYEADGSTPVSTSAWICIAVYPFGQGMGCLPSNTVVNGVYHFSGLPTGSYRVEAYADNHVGEIYLDIPVYLDWSQAVPVAVTAGADTANINFSLEPGGNITGTVFAADGVTPLGNIPVDLDQGGFGRCTQPDGTYFMDGVPVGVPLIIRAGGVGWDYCPGGTYLREFWEEAGTVGDATSITLATMGDTASGINFSLVVGGSISGRVTEADGLTPITNSSWGIPVCVAEYGTGFGYGCVNAAPDGTYVFGALPTGSFRVDTSAEHHVGEVFNNIPFYSDWGLATPIMVTVGANTPDINFALDPSGSITGVVYGADGITPLGGVPVDLDQGGFGYCSNLDGTYQITGIPLGMPVVVRAGGPGWDNCHGGHLTEWWNEASTSAEANPIQVTAMGETVPDINFTLDVAGTISGRVTEADGTTPITNSSWGVWVCVSDFVTDEGFGCTQPASDGTYTNSGMPTGSYQVSVYAENHIFEAYDNIPQYQRPLGMTPVVVTAGSTTPGIDFALEPGGTIAGTVFADDGITPLINVAIRVDLGTYTYCSKSPDGSYLYESLPLGVPITLSAGGLDDTDCGNTDYLREWWQESADGTGATPIVLSAGAGQNVTGKDFTLTHAGSISGILTEADSITPITAGQVCVNDFVTDAGMGCVPINPDGTYQVQRLEPGSYRVSAEAAGHIGEMFDNLPIYSDQNLATAVVVTGGADTPDINFALDLGGSISGHVYANDGITALANIPVDIDGGGFGRCTGSDGSYEITDLALGTYTVHAGGQGWPQCPGDLHMSEWWEESNSPGLADPIILAPGPTQNRAGIDFTLDVGGTISGTMTEADGATPLSGDVCVETYATSTQIGCLGVDPVDGTYTFGPLPAGTYRVSGNAPDHIEMWFDSVNFPADPALATPVIVTAGADTSGIDFALAPAGSISGTVFAADGSTPQANIPVDIEGGGYGRCTEADGSFAINGLPLGTALILHAGGVGWPECPGGTHLQEWWEEAADPGSADPITLSLGAGQHVTARNFTLEPAGSISGTVRDAVSNAVLGGIPVDLEGGGNGVCTEPDGTYMLTGLSLGTAYVVHAGGAGWPECPGDSHMIEWWEEAGTLGDADPVTLTAGAGQNVTGKDFTLSESLSGPSSLSAIVVNDNRVDLNWTDNSTDETAFHIERSPEGTTWVEIGTVAANVTAYSDLTPVCGGTYHYRVRAFRSPDSMYSSYSSPDDVATSPCPSGVTLLAPADDEFTRNRTPDFSWVDTLGTANRFRIQIASDAAFTTLVINQQVTTPSFTPTVSLAGNAEFWWRVSARDGSVWRDWTAAWKFTVDRTPPVVPTLLTPINGVTVNTLQDFCWSAAADAVLYDVEVSIDAAFGTVPHEWSVPDLCVTSPALADGIWFWRVRASDLAGNVSGWSSAWSVRVDLIPAAVPTLLLPADTTVTRDRTPAFSWSSVPGSMSYRIEIATDAGFLNIADSIGTTSTGYTPVSNLAEGTYFWHVAARANDGLWSAYSPPWTVTIDRTPPAVPVLSSPLNGATIPSLPTFLWDAVPTATAYDLLVATTPDLLNVVITLELPVTTHTPLALPDGLYYWTVRSIDSVGNKSSWSTTFSVRVDVIPALPPVHLTPADGLVTRDKTPGFSWMPAPTAKKYRIEIASDAGFASIVISARPTAALYSTVEKLPAGTYYWHVQSQSTDDLWSAFSSTWSFSIDRTAPAAPILVSPAHKAIVMTLRPVFDWQDSLEVDFDHYVIEIDNNRDFSSPILREEPDVSTFTPTADLPGSKVFWRVRAVDEVENRSEWSEPRKLEMTVLKAPPGFRKS
ncbi:MAG: hypothetical protein IPK52_25915 [Chloroflexi bacterium]|nr:hypothetical protein [Chloroflexota bacterium]